MWGVALGIQPTLLLSESHSNDAVFRTGRKYVKYMRRVVMGVFVLVLSAAEARPAAVPRVDTARVGAPAQTLRDGQHDFDFHFGTWETHIKRLTQPLSGSTNWVEMKGTVTVRPIWDGRGNLEEIDARNDAMHLQGMTLFLYDPESHQWSQTFASANDGKLEEPMVGEFKDGRGEFYSQETFNGRSVLVRFVWSDIRPDSHHVEQAFSADGGKTWEPNFIADLTRLCAAGETCPAAVGRGLE